MKLRWNANVQPLTPINVMFLCVVSIKIEFSKFSNSIINVV